MRPSSTSPALRAMLQRSARTTSAFSATKSTSFSSSVASPTGDDEQLQAARALLHRAIGERRSVRFFSDTPVPDALLADVLRLTQRAPTSFNTQPYACVLVRDKAERAKLADAMLAGNARVVAEAPVVAVFAADLEPSRRVPHIQQMMHKNGESTAAIQNLPHYMRLFAGEGHLASGFRSLLATAVSPLQAVPANVPTVAWAFKQTAFAAATFLFAAEASGLATSAMEGFDDARLKAALDIPDRYAVPVVVCCGYPQPEKLRTDSVTPRLAPTDVFFDGKFGHSSEKLFEEGNE